MSNTNQMTTVSQESGHNYSTETETVFDMIAQAIAKRDSNKADRAEMKVSYDQMQVNVALSAIAHCQKFGDIRPLGRVILQLKPCKQVITMIRMTMPELAMIKQVDKNNWNDFLVSIRNGKTAGNMEFDTDLLEAAESILTASKSDGNSPFAKGHGWEDTFPDNAPINKTKKIKSVKKSIVKTMAELKTKGGGNLTKAEWVELVNEAYADFNKAQSAAPSPDDH